MKQDRIGGIIISVILVVITIGGGITAIEEATDFSSFIHSSALTNGLLGVIGIFGFLIFTATHGSFVLQSREHEQKGE